MENLQGGMIALEHRYDVTALHEQRPYVTIYEGVQDPFEHPILIKIFQQNEQPLESVILDRLFEQTDRLSQLRHQGILKVLDHGELAPGQPFIITEGTHAPTLHEVLEVEGTLSPAETTALISRLSEALMFLHDQEITHGAISPCWIYMPQGDPTQAVLDHTQLGLSLDELANIDGALLDVDGLRALPPEMFRNEAEHFTQRSDIWALGALAYHCLVGIHPYFQDLSDPGEGLVQIKQNDPRRLEDFGVDPEMATIIHRALALNPEDRWASATAFAQALNQTQNFELVPTVQPTEPKTETSINDVEPVISSPNRTGTIAGLALLLLLVTNLAWCGHAMSGDLNTGKMPATMTNLPTDSQARLPATTLP